jgi:hypothetical protein
MKILRNVYIGAAMTHLPPAIFGEYKQTVEAMADLIAKLCNAKVTYALENSDPYLPGFDKERRPAECYRMDRELVEQSDLMIAEASFPSTGLGQELQMAAYNDVPVILCFRNWGDNIAAKKDYTTRAGEAHTIELGNKIVSSMVLGNPAVVHEILYKSIDACLEQLESFLRSRYTTVML